MTEVAEHHGLGRGEGDLSRDLLEHRVRDAAVVHRVDLQQPVIAAHEGILVRRRPHVVDDRFAFDPRFLQLGDDEVLEGVIAEDGGEDDVGPGRAEMGGHDGGAPDEIHAVVVAHARRGGLRHTADHGRVGEAVHDGVAHHVHVGAAEPGECLAEPGKRDALGVHQRDELFDRQVRRTGIDDGRGGIHDVARREQDLTAIALNRLELLLGFGMDPAVLILVALREEVGLDARQVFERRRSVIDDDVVDHVEGGQVERAQLLRDERPVGRLADLHVPGDAHHEDGRLALGVQQVPQVARVHEIEDAVAHDDCAPARARTYCTAQLFDRLDLVPEGLGQLCHVIGPEPRWSNHARVASAIEAASRSGASRQLSISAIIRLTPSSKETCGHQPSSH